MNHMVDVVSSDSSTSGTSAGRRASDGAGASAVGDSAGAKRGRKRPTMRMPAIRGTALAASRGSEGIQNIQGEAAVSPSRGSEHKPRRRIRMLKKKRRPTVGVQEQQREAAVGASRDIGSPPFEEESQENQLPSLRAAVRKHAAKGGGGSPTCSGPKCPTHSSAGRWRRVGRWRRRFQDALEDVPRHP